MMIPISRKNREWSLLQIPNHPVVRLAPAGRGVVLVEVESEVPADRYDPREGVQAPQPEVALFESHADAFRP